MTDTLLTPKQYRKLSEKIVNELDGKERVEEMLTQGIHAVHYLDDDVYTAFERQNLSYFLNELRLIVKELK